MIVTHKKTTKYKSNDFIKTCKVLWSSEKWDKLSSISCRFDVAQYKPEEVTVKTIDNRLLVHAKHEEKTPQRTVFREYNQVGKLFIARKCLIKWRNRFENGYLELSANQSIIVYFK